MDTPRCMTSLVYSLFRHAIALAESNVTKRLFTSRGKHDYVVSPHPRIDPKLVLFILIE